MIPVKNYFVETLFLLLWSGAYSAYQKEISFVKTISLKKRGKIV